MHQTKRTPKAWPRILLAETEPVEAERIISAITEHFGSAPVARLTWPSQALHTDLSQFDAIVLSLDLPDGDGLELLQQIVRQTELPVVALSRHRRSQTVAAAIRSGASDYLVKQGDYAVVLPVLIEKALVMSELRQQNQRLQRQLRQRNDELEQLNDRLAAANALLKQMADRDPLTGLTNRRHFTELLSQRQAEASRYNEPLACMMIDVDNFKCINDALGHHVGDQVLVLAGRILREQLRAVDLAARYGGDEFVVLLPHCTSHDAQVLAERIGRRFDHESRRLIRTGPRPSLSFGIAGLAGGDASTLELLNQADRALLEAKQAGKRRIVLARPAASLAS
ncbi:MAG: diguanylate cyclase [Phycisphaerae bacterium]